MITVGAISISQALLVNKTLIELFMGGTTFGNDGIAAIAGSLSKSSITLLKIEGCDITFIGVKLLAAVIQNIRELGLWKNLLTVDGARLIMESAVKNGVCEYVGINNEYEDDKKVKKMMTILDERRRQNIRNYVDLVLEDRSQ